MYIRNYEGNIIFLIK